MYISFVGCLWLALACWTVTSLARVVEVRSVEPLIIRELSSYDLRPILRQVTHPLADTGAAIAFFQAILED